jgi:hypothetical protein
VSVSKVKKLQSLTFNEWILILLSIYYLAKSKINISLYPFKKIAKTFGELGVQNIHIPSDSDYIQIEKIKLATLRAGRIVPWRSVCLDQAMCAAILLQRYKISYTLNLGVRKKEDGKSLDAHAWIVCGDKIVLGGEKSKFYIITASYSKLFLN